MMAQGVLGFQYEEDSSARGLTALGGLPVYLDLVRASGLADAIRRHVRVAGSRGWLDRQMVLALVFLNLAGGDCVEDIERLDRMLALAEVRRDRALRFIAEYRQLLSKQLRQAGDRFLDNDDVPRLVAVAKRSD